MAKIEIIRSFFDEIEKKFRGDAQKIFDLMESLENNPHKGKVVGYVTGMLIKELKYSGFRFYFIIDGGKLKFFSKEELENILIKFVRMSDKKSQQKTIEEIKNILRKVGEEGF